MGIDYTNASDIPQCEIRVMVQPFLDNPQYVLMEKAIGFLCTNFKEQPSLTEAASFVGLSEYHFQRVFQRWVGISPKQFLHYVTADYARHCLQECKDTLRVTEDAGLSSSSRLHELIVKVYAATPAELKHQGAHLTIGYGFHETPFGRCLIAFSGRGICYLSFQDGEAAQWEKRVRQELMAMWPRATCQPEPDLAGQYVRRIFAPEETLSELKVHVQGTAFQIKVWEALLRIPPARLVTYQAIAGRIGRPEAVRAVATAIGKNPVGFLVPCHRVIRQTGVIGGYRWGSDRKRMILGWEAAQCRSGEYCSQEA
jgi:AraC family transcriptional regulator of adaptative response/methylated-DNA-[protein]-cysteine methyltransferase